jgi:hypothetical protein
VLEAEPQAQPPNVLKVSRRNLLEESVSSDYKTVRYTSSEHEAVHGRCLRVTVERVAELSSVVEPIVRSLSAPFGCLMLFCPSEIV